MRFFRKRSPTRHTDDPDFGPIGETKNGSWTGDGFRLWGYDSIQVMIDAGPDGPSAEQRSFIRSLRADTGMRARIEQAVAIHAARTARQKGSVRVSSVYLPQSPLRQTWRIWFDMEGEEHYSYGAEIEGWNRIVPFTED